jgi:tetratricopeptide (TPR) repeat protein
MLGAEGEFQGGPLGFEPILLMPGDENERDRQIFTHELSHRFIRQRYPQVPVWLNEGLAEYYSTLRVEPGGAVVGGRPAHYAFSSGKFLLPMWDGAVRVGVWIPTALVPRSDALRKMDRRSFYALRPPNDRPDPVQVSVHYAAAWSFVHHLISDPNRRPAFFELLDALGEGSAFKDAWEQAFGELAAERLEEEFRSHLLEPFPEHVVAYSAQADTPARERVMREEEVLLLWARTRYKRDPALARSEVRRALSIAPDAPGAHVLLGVFFEEDNRAEEAHREFRRAFELGGGRPRTTFPLAVHLLAHPSDPAELDEVASRLSVSDSVQAQAFAAEIELLLHRVDSSLALARKAITRDPACFICLDALAQAQGASGDSKSAIENEWRAIDLAPEGADTREMEQRIKEWRRAR